MSAEIFEQISENHRTLLNRLQTDFSEHDVIRGYVDQLQDITLALQPRPKDPAAHLTQSHEQARPYLVRLTKYPAHVDVIINENGYSYTPRKILRRVLDHAIDHLNQIEQWVLWQRRAIAPTPADGWAGSKVTFPDDHVPLHEDELNAWLWRIDITNRTIEHRLWDLSAEQIHWQPPDDGWSIYTIIHHLAFGELFYATAIENALPPETALRLPEAITRFQGAAQVVLKHPIKEDQSFYLSEDEFSLEGLLRRLLEQQSAVLEKA